MASKTAKAVLFPGIDVRVDHVSDSTDILVVEAVSTARPGRCPDCRIQARRMHSTHQGTVNERPLDYRRVPSRCQRRNRSYTRAHGPYRSGTSHHGTPVRVRNRMPSISCRRLHLGGRPGFLPLGNNDSNRAHCVSVRSPRATR